MRRLTGVILICLLAAALCYQPPRSAAQESPRSDPTAAAPGAAALPPTTAPTTSPAARPDDAPSKFDVLSGREGYWRIGRDHVGAWWFIAPTGTVEFLNTVTTVQPSLLARDRFGADYMSRDWNPTGDQEVELDRWAKATSARVLDSGFKGLGAWSHPALHKQDIPMTRDLNVWSWLRAHALFRLFSADWATVAESAIRQQVEPLRENRNLVGYYVDNELDWGDTTSGPGAYFNDLQPNDPNRAAVTAVIRQTWPTVHDFNTAWGTDLKDYAELDGWRQLPHDPANAYQALGHAWLSHLADVYWKTTTTLIRKHDPNHLILGSRFRGSAEPEVVAASKGYTDAQSLNYYVSDAKLDAGLFKMLHESSGQPLILSEYGFHALDGRSGDRDTVGFPGQVLDQQARAEAYKLFTTRLARVPWVIGADWFQWMDEPPSGRKNDGEDVNFGIVDVDDRPYQPMVDAVRDTAPKLNALHEAAATQPAAQNADLWRESFSHKPVARVPYLAKPIRLNGELSDWPASARIGRVRATESVGHERNPLPEPNVYLGWREEGLYLAMEVFDRHVATAPPTGWWWSRDSVEFFVSTRPVTSDQTGYDDHCHHFFFVPVDFPAGDGIGGVVGQWHTPGDAIDRNLVPQPDARVSVRVLPDRYVAEIFLPAKSLVGWNPTAQPTLAFNIHVRDYEQAAEYYWSAPKQVLTQCRPATWGVAALQPKEAPPVAPIAGTDANNVVAGN